MALYKIGSNIIRASGGGGLFLNGAGGGSGDIYALYANLTPTIYAAPADVGSGDGSSEANAQDFPTVLANATAGAIIGMIPGTYTHVASPAYRSNVPGWHPANSGTSGSPIIIVAKYPGAGLSTPLSNANRTELRAGSGAFNGSDSHPVFGANNRDYVRWIGMVIDEDNCVTKYDNGPGYIADSTGIWIKYCVVRGSLDSAHLLDNHSALRIGEGGTTDTGHVITGNIFYNFTVGLDTNAAAIITYGAQDTAIEYNHFYDCTTGLYIKGSGGSGANYNSGSISYNRIHDVDVVMRLQASSSTQDTVVTNNLIYNFSIAGIAFNDSGGDVRRIKMTRNTVVVTEAITIGGFWLEPAPGTSNEFNDNIIAMFNSTGHNYVYGFDYTANGFSAFDYNGFYGSTDGTPWSWNGGNQNSVANFEAAVTNSNNNQVLGSDPFVNQGTGDYTVTGAALTASSTGGPIGADYSQVGPQ